MRIGISVLTHQGQNIWENGLGQNVIFLAQAFRQIPFVTSIDLINAGDQAAMPDQVDTRALGLRLLTLAESSNHLDIAIELGGGLDVKWLDRFRAQGKKVVWHAVGQPYVGLVEPSVFGNPGFFSRVERCDEIWSLPKDFATFSPMQRILFRCPVRETPYLWSPQFLDQRAAQLEREGFRFGYQPRVPDTAGRRRGLRVAIMEPNISVVKASSIPMLACDEAYRADPASVECMHVLNTLHMKEHPTLLYLANSLDLVRQHKAVFQSRHDFAGYMVQHTDAVVSHQWQNDQNYLYLDALHGGYPLVHNSPWLRGVGYYYPDFDCQEGGRQLLRAALTHDDNLDAYRASSKSLIDRLHPLAPENVRAYAHLLLALWHGGGKA
jgi:hypothetical protein